MRVLYKKNKMALSEMDRDWAIEWRKKGKTKEEIIAGLKRRNLRATGPAFSTGKGATAAAAQGMFDFGLGALSDIPQTAMGVYSMGNVMPGSKKVKQWEKDLQFKVESMGPDASAGQFAGAFVTPAIALKGLSLAGKAAKGEGLISKGLKLYNKYYSSEKYIHRAAANAIPMALEGMVLDTARENAEQRPTTAAFEGGAGAAIGMMFALFGGKKAKGLLKVPNLISRFMKEGISEEVASKVVRKFSKNGKTVVKENVEKIEEEFMKRVRRKEAEEFATFSTKAKKEAEEFVPEYTTFRGRKYETQASRVRRREAAAGAMPDYESAKREAKKGTSRRGLYGKIDVQGDIMKDLTDTAPRKTIRGYWGRTVRNVGSQFRKFGEKTKKLSERMSDVAEADLAFRAELGRASYDVKKRVGGLPTEDTVKKYQQGLINTVSESEQKKMAEWARSLEERRVFGNDVGGLAVDKRELYVPHTLTQKALDRLNSEKGIKKMAAEYAEQVKKNGGVIAEEQSLRFLTELRNKGAKRGGYMADFEKRRSDKDMPLDWFILDSKHLDEGYNESMANRVAFSREFGSKGEDLFSSLAGIAREAKTNPDIDSGFVGRVIDRFLNRQPESAAIKNIKNFEVGTKMIYSQMSNIVDISSTAAKYGVFETMWSAFAQLGPATRRRAAAAGGALDVSSRARMSSGTMNKFAKGVMKYTGFNFTQMWADNTAVTTAFGYVKKLKKAIIKAEKKGKAPDLLIDEASRVFNGCKSS